MFHAPNLQRLRHGWAADSARRMVYGWIVGDGAWPPTFRAPAQRPVVRAPSANVYVHLPFCTTLCPHCPYNKVRFDAEQSSAYHAALLREVGAYLVRPGLPRVETLYFGGGTPTLTPQTLAATIDRFRPHLSDDAQVATEGYPSDASEDLLRDLRAMGINRISLGIEALDAALLKRLGRRYDPLQAIAAMERAKAAGFDMLDVNLIFGIPGQSPEGFLDGVRACLSAGVDQISAYPLFTFDHTPAGQPSREDLYARADERDRLAMQRGVSEICREAGFERTSVWSFTRRGLSPYTTVTRPDYIGFGAGAGSKSEQMATFNTFSVPSYVEAAPEATALVHELSPAQERADWLYWQFYNCRIDHAGYHARFGRPLDADFGPALRIMRGLGLLTRDGDSDRLTEKGAVWGHRVQSLFSLNGIDKVWTACQREPWPDAVPLT